MVSSPSATSSEKRIERDKRKEEAQKLKRKKEIIILKNIGIAKKAPKCSKPSPEKHRPLKEELSNIPKNFRIEMPSRTEQSVIEILATPLPMSPLSPVTDMSLVPLAVLELKSGLSLPVLNSYFF